MGAKVTKVKEAEEVLRERGAHFLTGIRPSWFTCSFSFVYLGTQVEGSRPGNSYLNPPPRPRCTPPTRPPRGRPRAHALRKKVFREAF